MSHFERACPRGEGFSVRQWSSAAAAAAANVCGKCSRTSHGIWSLLVLSALADSSEGFGGTHQKLHFYAFYCHMCRVDTKWIS